MEGRVIHTQTSDIQHLIKEMSKIDPGNSTYAESARKLIDTFKALVDSIESSDAFLSLVSDTDKTVNLDCVHTCLGFMKDDDSEEIRIAYLEKTIRLINKTKIEFSRDSDDILLLSYLLSDAGEWYQKRGHFEQAREYYLQSILTHLKMSPSNAEYFVVCYRYGNLALTYDKQTIEYSLFECLGIMLNLEDESTNKTNFTVTYADISLKIDAFLQHLKPFNDHRMIGCILPALYILEDWYNTGYFDHKKNCPDHLFHFITVTSIQRLKKDIEKLQTVQTALSDILVNSPSLWMGIAINIKQLTDNVAALNEKVDELEKENVRLKRENKQFRQHNSGGQRLITQFYTPMKKRKREEDEKKLSVANSYEGKKNKLG